MSLSVKRAISIGAAVIACASLWSPPAHADDNMVQARAAYERGAKASKAGDYATAAKEFAHADELAPSPTALEAALDAAVQADDPALGAELLERSKRGEVSGTLAESVKAAHAKFDGRGGYVRVPCPSAPCKVELDGKEVDAQKPIWAPKGTHAVVRQDASGTKAQMFANVKPDETVDVESGPAPGSPSPTSKEDGHGKKLPPVVTYAGAGLTVIAGVATVVFGLSANGKHDDFESAGCGRGGSPVSNCSSIKDDGTGKETLANVALVSTVVFGVATGVIAVFFTDWHGGKGKDQTSSKVRSFPLRLLSSPQITF